MAASIPEGTWIFIVILAVIILAILSNDSISRRSSSSSTSSSSSSGGGSSSSSSSSDSTNRPPSINGYHTGDEYVGGSFGVRGNFSAGGASDYELEASINGSAVDIDTNGQSFRTEEANVQRGENHYKVKIQTSAGQDEDRGSFPSTQEDPDSSRNPRVRVTEQRVSPTGDFRLEAMAESRSDADIALTGFVKLTHTRGSIFDFSSLEDSDKVSPGRQHVLEGSIPTSNGNIAAGTVHYKAKTKDTEGRTGTYQDSFSFERGISGDNSASGGGSGGSVDVNVAYGGSDSGTGDGSGSSSSGDGGDSRGQYPELARLISYIADTHLGDLGGFQGDEDVMAILEQILEQVDSSGSDGETARVGMDAYQLLLAMNALGADLDGDDNQQIVAELRQISQQMGDGGMSSDELENALRTVLHDVFGQDLQGVIEGLDLGDGFDEDAIVDAIENKDLDLSDVTDRLDNIEQAVAQIQSQGGDLGDVEQKLDDIESAVRDLQVDDQIFQDLTAEIRSLRDQGVQVDVDMNDPLMIKLAEDIQRSGDPQAERQKILQGIRQEGTITRRLLIQLLDGDSKWLNNINSADYTNAMPNNIEGLEHELDQDIKRQIEHLEGEYDNLRQLVGDLGEIDKLEGNMTHEVEEVTNHLKRARQIEHHLDTLFDEKKNMSDSDFAKKLNDDLHNLNGHIKKANSVISTFRDDFGVFREDVSDLDSVAAAMEKVEGQIEQQEEELNEVEDHMESAIEQLQNNPDVDMEEFT